MIFSNPVANFYMVKIIEWFIFIFNYIAPK